MLAEARKKGKNGITGAFEELGGGNDGQARRCFPFFLVFQRSGVKRIVFG